MIQETNIFSKSLLAGIAIGFGGLINLSCSNNVIGAVLFSVGLLSVYIFELNLFTGKSGFLSDKYDFRRVILVLIINLLGAYLLGLLTHFMISDIRQPADMIVSNRLGTDISTIFMKSILTGFLMTLAIESEKRQNSNHLILILSVVGFILSGSFHCIADAFYYGVSSMTFSNPTQAIARLLVVIVANFIGCNLYNLTVSKGIIHGDAD